MCLSASFSRSVNIRGLRTRRRAWGPGPDRRNNLFTCCSSGERAGLKVRRADYHHTSLQNNPIMPLKLVQGGQWPSEGLLPQDCVSTEGFNICVWPQHHYSQLFLTHLVSSDSPDISPDRWVWMRCVHVLMVMHCWKCGQCQKKFPILLLCYDILHVALISRIVTHLIDV